MSDNNGRIRFYVALDTDAIIAVKGDAVFVPERAGTARQDGSCGPLDVVQGRLTLRGKDALRALQRDKAVQYISNTKIPDTLKKTLKHEIERIETGKGGRVLGLARFCLPWDYALDRQGGRDDAPPKPPPPDIFKLGLLRLARKVKAGSLPPK